MKKAVKKLNKTLSVLLAAGMIVGMTPEIVFATYATEEVASEETPSIQEETKESEPTTVEETTEESTDNMAKEEAAEEDTVLQNDESVELTYVSADVTGDVDGENLRLENISADFTVLDHTITVTYGDLLNDNDVVVTDYYDLVITEVRVGDHAYHNTIDGTTITNDEFSGLLGNEKVEVAVTATLDRDNYQYLGDGVVSVPDTTNINADKILYSMQADQYSAEDFKAFEAASLAFPAYASTADFIYIKFEDGAFKNNYVLDQINGEAPATAIVNDTTVYKVAVKGLTSLTIIAKNSHSTINEDATESAETETAVEETVEEIETQTVESTDMDELTATEDEKAESITTESDCADTTEFTMAASATVTDGEETPPVLKLSKVESLAQSFNKIKLTLTADKNVKDTAQGAYVYYEVTVTPQDGAAPAGSDRKVLYIPKKGESQSVEVSVNTADPTKAAWKYDFEVRLVLSRSELPDGTTAATDLVAEGKSIRKTFATKNAYYEDKLSVTKKNTMIYTGQSGVTIAVVKFSKNTSYVDNVTIERVLDKNGVDVTDHFIVEQGRDVSNLGYEVRIGAKDYVMLGKYNVEIAAEAEKSEEGVQTMHRATATIPITVVAGINVINVDNKVRIAQSGKKDVTYTIKPSGYADVYINSMIVKAKSQKYTYELVVPQNAAQKANVEKNVVVNPTNGKVTVRKDFVIGDKPNDNCFKVRVTANDFTNPDGTVRKSTTVKFQVARDSIEIGEIYVAPKDDPTKNLGTSLTIDQADKAKIIVKDTNGNIINDCVTFTPSYKDFKTNGVFYDGRINAAKAGTMNVKVTTEDGGRKSKSIKVIIRYKDFTNMSYEVFSYDTTVVETAHNQWNYKATKTPQLYIAMQDIVDDTKISAYDTIYNYSIKVVKGGSLVLERVDHVIIVPTAKEMKVAIKIGRTTTYVTITNDAYPTDKPPKATTKDKLYKGLCEAQMKEKYGHFYFPGATQTLTYTVDSDKYKAVNVCGLDTDPYNFGSRTYTIKDRKFTLTNDWIGTSDVYNSGKYSFVYGDIKDGDFIPATQPAIVTIKAYNIAAYKPVTSYRINPAENRTITLTGKPANVDVIYCDLQNANVKGQANAFRDLFTLKSVYVDGKCVNTLTLKTDEAAKKALKDKANYTGYVTYKYVNVGLNAKYVIKTAKITVSFDNKDYGDILLYSEEDRN